MATFVYPPQQVTIPGAATEATLLDVLAEVTDINANTADVSTATKQDAQTAILTDIETNTTGLATEATLSALAAEDFATQTTLAALNAKVTAVDTGDVTVSASALPTGAATEASLAAAAADVAALNARTAGSLVPEEHDYIENTYVGATTDLNTVTYKTGGAGGTTVAVLTMGYDGSNRLTSVTRS